MGTGTLPTTRNADAPRPRCAPAAALLLALLAPALAAQMVRFDPQQHLEGFSECLLSEYRDLYDLEQFRRYQGQNLTPEQLRDLRQTWRAERERVAGRIEVFRRDPRAYFLYRLERRLLQHPYFSRVRFDRFETHDPFVFLIQPPRTSHERYQETIIDALGEPLQRLRESFDEVLGVPLELEARKGFALPLLVLADRGEYARYTRTLEEPALFFAQAHWDPELEAVVGYVAPDEVQRRPFLHEAVHALCAAHGAANDGPVSEAWLGEGLASFLSSRIVGPEPAPDLPSDLLAVQAMVQVARDPELRAACMLPVEELCTVRSYADAYDRMRRNAAAEGVAPPGFSKALLGLYGQAGTWVHHLFVGDGGAWRDGFLEYLRNAFEGRGGSEVLRLAYEGRPLAHLNESYEAWIEARLQLWDEHLGPEGADLEATFSLSEAAQAVIHREVEERIETLEVIAPDRTAPEVRFATAVRDARAGRYVAASQDVQILLSYEPEGEFRDRLERELERLEGMRAIRREHMEWLRDTEKKLNLMLGDRRLLAHVEEVEGTRVLLGPNRAEVDELELDDVDPLQLLRLVRASRVPLGRPWLLAYPEALAGDEDWERPLEDAEAPGAAALRADVESGDYREWLRLSDAVEELVALSEAGLPETEEDARLALERLGRLREDFLDLELVRERKQALIQLSYRAQALLFPTEGMRDVLHAEIEELGDGALRLTYAFDDPAEDEDFRAERYLDELRWQGSPEPEASRPFTVGDGALAGRGAACSRHVLEFEGAQTVRMRFVFRTPEGAVDQRLLSLLGICDDGAGSYVTTSMLGAITVCDRETAYLQQSQTTTQVYLDTVHEVDIRHDGVETVTTYFDGQLASETPCGPRLAGGLFVWMNSECPLEIVDLVIEARASPGSLRLLRAEWIDAKLEEMGWE